MNDYKFSDMKIGLEESFDVTITNDVLLKFTEISGDVNPLHTDYAYAQSKGFNGRVDVNIIILFDIGWNVFAWKICIATQY